MKVLIIDPDWTFSRQAAGYLESIAHLVVHKADKAQAIDLAHRWQPDLLIVAAEYVEDGILDDLKAAAGDAAILLTEFMERYDRAWRAWQMGGDELLMKPVFQSKDLHNAIVAARESATTGVRVNPMSESA